MAETLGVLLLSGGHERTHFAFVMASAAAAAGRNVVMYASNAGCHALLADLAAHDRDAEVRSRGVAGVAELRGACVELGVRLMACSAGLAAEAIEPARLLPGVAVAGIPAFLSAVAGGQVITI